MSGPLLRRAAVFLGVAGLGLALVLLVAERPATPGGRKPSVPVVPIPEGTDLQGPRGVPGISLVQAERVRVSPVQEVGLEDGSRVPFRSLVLWADAERPLPSPAQGVRRAALTHPVVLMLPVPKTRLQYDAAATDVPTRMEAPDGVLESGPGEASRLVLRGGVRVDTVREGTPWTFRGDEADVDLQARTVHAPGAVVIDSEGIHVEGRGLDATEGARTATIAEAAHGKVSGSRGVRVAGGPPGGETRFRCSGPFHLLPRVGPAAPGPAPAKPAPDARPEKYLLVLDREAVLEQDGGSLAGDHIELDVARAAGGAAEGGDLEEVRAAGHSVLSGGKEGRDLRATADRLRARPLARGSTEVLLDGAPCVTLRETSGGRETRTVEARGRGPARMVLPREEGPVEAVFRGSATAVLIEPASAEGASPRRRDLSAGTLTLRGNRDSSGRTAVESVLADGDALLREADRSARANRIDFRPAADGSSHTEMMGAVLVSWPAAGALDPVGAVAPGGTAAAGAEAGGTMLLSTPHRAILDLPPEGDASRGAAFEVPAGAVLRRVLGEREIYHLVCAAAKGTTQSGNRGLDWLLATGDVKVEGREEGPGARRYDLRGETLEVHGAPGSKEARTADLHGVTGRTPATAKFVGDDGRPLAVDADAIRFDRSTGAFHAEGNVRGKGVLPEGGPAGGGLPRAGGGQAELACAALDGVLVPGGTPGSSRVQSLDAKDRVWVKTETQYASGDSLRYSAEKGTAVLRGDPARLTARSGGAAAALKLKDTCDAPEMLLTLAEGRLVEGRSERGGILVSYRAEDPPSPGKEAPPPERLEARCRGPLVYRPEETSLAGEVVVVRSALQGDEFREKDRLTGADEVRVFHPPGKDGSAGPVERAVADSAAGGLDLVSASAGWHASGVSRVEYEAGGDRVVLEASPSVPRFRVVSDAATQTYRRVVYDYRQRIFAEALGATIEGTGSPR